MCADGIICSCRVVPCRVVLCVSILYRMMLYIEYMAIQFSSTVWCMVVCCEAAMQYSEFSISGTLFRRQTKLLLNAVSYPVLISESGLKET